MTCDMETSIRESPSYHAADVEMAEPHSVCSFIPLFSYILVIQLLTSLQCTKCSRSSESEHQSSPNIGSMAEPVSRYLEDVSSLD